MLSKTYLNKQWHVLWPLAKTDFKSRYLGSMIGTTWAFIMPVLNLLIMWFAFSVGLKSTSSDGSPFILWLVTGLFPWSFFSDAVNSAMNSIVEKSFLVKKMVFQVEFLPLIKIISSSLIFIFLNFLMILIFLLNSQSPTLYWLQLPYFAICLLALILSLSWLTSAIVVFYRDLGQVISVGLQLAFWATPVVWNVDTLPDQYKVILNLNPVAYVISGYRSSLFSTAWFWDRPVLMLYFWCFIFGLSALGLILFKKLRPHFADVL